MALAGFRPAPTAYRIPWFDAGKAIDAGSKYQFQFNNAGAWGFHNHLNPPGATGLSERVALTIWHKRLKML